MKLKLLIVDLEMSPRAKSLLLRLGLPIVIVLGGSALAYAGVPKIWSTGDTLSAADLNGNFSALDTRITALESEGGRFVGVVNGKKYSVGATSFVMETSTGGPHNDGTYDGAQVGGYPGAKAACEVATGSASAHMCAGEEIARSAAVGIAVPSTVGWYAGMFRGDNGGLRYDDCGGYSLNISTETGATNTAGSWRPGVQYCSVAYSILCCD